ncbi:hypothetical protein D6C99_08056 [Aureobasidium pullulans]|nr:hypothetical protein D6C99_08056 [Aureobasidium pullulans]
MTINMICQTLAWLASYATVATADFPWLSPVYDQIFQVALPIPSIKVPKRTHTSPATGLLMDYYEVDIKPLEVQVYPNLGKTRLVGYDGQNPGPTFMMTKGREAVVRFINHADRANSVHLHGSYTRAPFDGWADDTTESGQYKDHYYLNGQNARTLWYHDHAIDHTAENAYYGQAGFYILHDPDELKIPGLPQGDFGIPLALAAKRYNPDGSLWDPDANNEETSVFVKWQINGEVWSDGPEARVLAKPERGAIEVWELKNGGGGRSHPIYIHLVDFQITSRIGGRGQVLPYEAVALKDVIWLNTGETICSMGWLVSPEYLQTMSRFELTSGQDFICSTDHEMMAAFNVTVLADLGYNDTTRFLDPMEPKYRAVDYPASDFTSHTGVFSDSAIDQKLDFFANLDAYAHEADADAALVSYWNTHVAGAPNTLSTSTKSSTTTTSSKSSTTSTVKTTKSSSSTSTKSTASSSAV